MCARMSLRYITCPDPSDTAWDGILNDVESFHSFGTLPALSHGTKGGAVARIASLNASYARRLPWTSAAKAGEPCT